MSLIAHETGKQFHPCPEGTHRAVCIDAIDHGIQAVEFGGEIREQHKITLRWQVDEIDPENDGCRFWSYDLTKASRHERRHEGHHVMSDNT